MKPQRTFFGAAVLLLAACGPLEIVRDLPEVDVTPPTLLAADSPAAGQLALSFDEPCTLRPESLRCTPAIAVCLPPVAEDVAGNPAPPPAARVLLRTDGQESGREYLLEAVAEDARSNQLSFLARFYGFNPSVPGLRLNEFTPRGSGTHPDLVELRVMAGGNMGGVTLYQGTPHSWQDRLVFPAFTVAEGDFILVHFKPEGTPQEVDETGARDASGGLDASDLAYDFWIRGGSGISGNNGVLTLYERPGGEILDGVLYSDRTSGSDETYGGFGTAVTLERAEELVRDGGWRAAGERVRPEDAVSPEGSSGTRSVCRGSDSADTDGREDWHIAPTRGATFGAPNSDEVYVP